MDMGQIGANPPGSDIYVNEPHISGGVPILSKTDEGVRYHEHDFWERHYGVWIQKEIL